MPRRVGEAGPGRARPYPVAPAAPLTTPRTEDADDDFSAVG